MAYTNADGLEGKAKGVSRKELSWVSLVLGYRDWDFSLDFSACSLVPHVQGTNFCFLILNLTTWMKMVRNEFSGNIIKAF